ncbi:MAG: 2-amino-4-hydroxy-6-hydroxymethyldihydropteridine diphosphokinase [Coriobacteriia bacterium]|nr:2-amino-4-hydroxy-6-hydroxymethyldihydropteridine diphosphokinase [Coriobacteriia bacterium]
MNTQVFLGLGSNVGDRLETLRRALDAIDALDTTTVLAVSHVVESEPWGVTGQPLFANAVARIGTSLPADRLLGFLQEIELALGREKTERYGPRAIDIDIVLYGDEEWETPDLVVPHPRLFERDFVVTPLLEVDPDVCWPDGTPVNRERATEGRVTRVIGTTPGYEDRTSMMSGGTAETSVDGSWEVVASTRFSISGGLTYATELRFDAAILEQEGIPYAWDPLPPAEEYNLYLMPRAYHLLVPVSMAGQARELLALVHASGVIDPDTDTVDD